MRFLVKSNLKAPPTEAVIALFPAEQARGQELDEQGIREALYSAADMSAAWQLLNCRVAGSIGGDTSVTSSA